MAYSDKVIDHFDNPRNVGSMDKNDPDVGTGIVGAPECFDGETLIATADGTKFKTLKELFSADNVVPVWSFNLTSRQFEIKPARALFTGRKQMCQLELSDGGKLLVTPNHEFLLRPDYHYAENSLILPGQSVRPFRRYVSKRGYWRIRDTAFQYEYLEYFRFYHTNTDLSGSNIHHKDHNKRNDCIDNLELMSIAEHLHEHRHNMGHVFSPSLNKRDIESALSSSYARPEAADLLDVFVDELYQNMSHYGVGTRKRKTTEEIRKLSSERMKGKNPYRFFTKQQKRAFASHPGKSNGRWVDTSREELLKAAHQLYKSTGELTAVQWCEFAKKHELPQNLTARFKTWSNFKHLAINFNHTIVTRSDSTIRNAYTLQVEGNNNYVVLSKITKNTNEGIVVKNCGDVMRLQLRIRDGVILDAKFKTFGCGSAIASSSLATEWIMGKTLEEAYQVKNVAFVEELSLPPVKIHCSVLAEDAIKAAISDYKKKHDQSN